MAEHEILECVATPSNPEEALQLLYGPVLHLAGTVLSSAEASEAPTPGMKRHFPSSGMRDTQRRPDSYGRMGDSRTRM
jgi:hypothetical protein